MGRHRVVFANFALLLFVGYGLTRHAGILAPTAPSASAPEGGKQAAAPNKEVQERTVASLRAYRAALNERRPMTRRTEGVYWTDLPIPVDTGPDGPPIDLGEPVDADDDWGAELAITLEEPVDIGAELDVGDPWGWAQEAPSEPTIDIGVALDPDDHEASDLAVAADEPMEIGPYLDAEDPSGWEPDNTAGAPIEIGYFLDAGTAYTE